MKIIKARPTVGDRVVIVQENQAGAEDNDRAGTNGMTGVIVQDDHTDWPYEIRLENGKSAWYRRVWVTMQGSTDPTPDAEKGFGSTFKAKYDRLPLLDQQVEEPLPTLLASGIPWYVAKEECYEIVLDKTSGEKVGVRTTTEVVDHFWVLIIDAVEGGLIGAFNEDNPERAVQVGDFITEINGARDSGEDLVGELKQNHMLKITLKRRKLAQVKVKASGRTGIVMGEAHKWSSVGKRSYKLKFSDAALPEMDDFFADAVGAMKA